MAEPVAGRAFENRRNLSQSAAWRCTGENPGLGCLCGNALRQSQCGKDGCYRCVYQYRLSRRMDLVSRDLAARVLTDLVGALDSME